MPDYVDRGRFILQPALPTDPQELQGLRERNNPHNEAVGHFTGRCMHCGSDDLWDDNLAYGCNCCGALLSTN